MFLLARALSIAFLAAIMSVRPGVCEEFPDIKYGFITDRGNTAVECKFLDAKDFSEQLAPVLVQDLFSKSWGFIDTNGRIVIAPAFQSADSFSEGLAPVSSGENNLIGYIDRSGRFKIKPTYWFAGSFKEGRALVVFPGELNASLIDQYGSVVVHNIIQLRYQLEMPENWRQKSGPGLSSVVPSDALQCDLRQGPVPTFDGKFIDESGKVTFKGSWVSVEKFSEGLAVQKKESMLDRKFGYVDITGRTVIPVAFDEAAPFSEGLARVRVGAEKKGFIDKTGKWVLLSKDATGDFHGGLARASQQCGPDKRLWGFIDRSGRYLVKPQFEEVGDFYENLAAVQFGNNGNNPSGWSYIDRNGHFLTARRFARANPFHEGLACVGCLDTSAEQGRDNADLISIYACIVVFALIIISKAELFYRRSLWDSRVGPLFRIFCYLSASFPALISYMLGQMLAAFGLAFSNGRVHGLEVSKAAWQTVFFVQAIIAPAITAIVFSLLSLSVCSKRKEQFWLQWLKSVIIMEGVEYALIAFLLIAFLVLSMLRAVLGS